MGTQNIFNHPLSFTHDGGEAIFNLPNGLQGYYLVNASGFRLDEAPINIVSNPAASDPTVRNGISCFGCHTEGMKTFEDQVRAVIESNTAPTYNKAQALRLYVEKSEMDALVTEDMNRYREALEATDGMFGDIEPISRFHEAFQGEVDAAYAAAIVGLETEAFLEKIRENVGLQNAGLLVLDSEDGGMKRDAWTSSFRDIVFALNFPELVDKPPIVVPPDHLPGAIVHIPDSNLRAAIAEALSKSPNAPLTAEEVERLKEIEVPNRGIQDLTGLQFATNLNRLYLMDNQISDLSPIAGLINLHRLRLDDNPVSDISPLKGLKNLTRLWFNRTPVSDLSPIAGLINLEDLSLSESNVSDLSPIAGLINLRSFFSWGSPLSDLSPFAGLKKMEDINICAAKVSDLTPLAGLTQLKKLNLRACEISDLSPIAGLTGLTWLGFLNNNVSDISPLAGLIHLTHLDIAINNISDISPLDGFRDNLETFLWFDNPVYPKGGPKIEGPWLWAVLPNAKWRHLESGDDLLSKASTGTVTETEIATHGAIEGSRVGDSIWTLRRLPTTDWNIEDMLGQPTLTGIVYGVVPLYSPQEQDTTIYVGSNRILKVWLNGVLIHHHPPWSRDYSTDYTDFYPTALKQGRNVLLIAAMTRSNAFVGFEPGTEYTVANPGVRYTFSKAPIHMDDTFTLDISAETVFDLAGWQFDIAFDPAALEAIDVSEGDFLKTDGGTTFFQGGSIDNAAGKITGLSAARLSAQGVSGTGTLLQVRFKAKSAGETQLALHKFEFGTGTGDNIPAGPHEIRIVVEERLTTGDVNRDGRVSILDLILVAQQLGKRVSAGSTVDINGDGVVSILDLIRVAQGIAESAAAPTVGTESIDAATIEAWIAQARLEDDGSLAFKQGIENLENLLASLIPEETALLRNYPNPFNPETWIPYQLAESAEVTLIIYDLSGKMVRRLAVGHQAAGMYRSRSRAVYWDGRNQVGEPLASGLYFYTLTTGEFTATRRMLILK